MGNHNSIPFFRSDGENLEDLSRRINSEKRWACESVESIASQQELIPTFVEADYYEPRGNRKSHLNKNSLYPRRKLGTNGIRKRSYEASKTQIYKMLFDDEMPVVAFLTSKSNLSVKSNRGTQRRYRRRRQVTPAVRNRIRKSWKKTTCTAYCSRCREDAYYNNYYR